MNLTLEDIANKYDIAKATVNARLKKLIKENTGKTLSIKKKNIIYLTDTGAKLLEEDLKKRPVKKKKKHETFKKDFKTDFKNPFKEDLFKESLEFLENPFKESPLLKDPFPIDPFNRALNDTFKTDPKSKKLKKKIQKKKKKIDALEKIEREQALKIKELEAKLIAKDEIIKDKDKMITILEANNKNLIESLALKDKLQGQALHESHLLTNQAQELSANKKEDLEVKEEVIEIKEREPKGLFKTILASFKKR